MKADVDPARFATGRIVAGEGAESTRLPPPRAESRRRIRAASESGGHVIECQGPFVLNSEAVGMLQGKGHRQQSRDRRHLSRSLLRLNRHRINAWALVWIADIWKADFSSPLQQFDSEIDWANASQ